MRDFEVNLTKRVQDHPSLKALTIKGYYRSMPLVKGAVAGMSKRGSVEKLVVRRYDGKEPLCRVSLSESPTCQLIVCLSCLCVWYGGTVWCMSCLRTLLSKCPYVCRIVCMQ